MSLPTKPYKKNKKKDDKIETPKEQSPDISLSKVDNNPTKKIYTKIEPKKPSEPLQRKDVRKRRPQRPATITTDIYVSTRSNFNGQLFRAKKLLMTDGHPSITIHGLGAAIQNTVQIVDDIIPDDDDKDLESQTRQNSAVHIQVSLKDDVKKYVSNKKNFPSVKR
ncbi:2968_t:CDS:2 [Funneliformis geosporum]|uniref:3521_t:CDS:1 n=1 Tax=Funneliformis geosporum TaxID=1117311 RepID=A0A9W4SR66_9GLOM|nr:2968_t:CDS:2 [Funneliformis geosporum]CAI2176168.1 3521_t:CDS:2 [Funneliformis geosporum]